MRAILSLDFLRKNESPFFPSSPILNAQLGLSAASRGLPEDVSLKGIALEKQIELFAWSTKLVKSKSLRERRLGLVLLTHFVKDRNSRTQIEETLGRLRGDKEDYVKKESNGFKRIYRNSFSRFLNHRQMPPKMARMIDLK